jgi:hypothetical protein
MQAEPSTVEVENPEEAGKPSKKKVNKQTMVHKLKDKIAKFKVLERHLKKENETLRKSSLKIGSALDKLAIKYENTKHKNKKLLKHNGILKNMNKVLRFNIAQKNLKPIAHLRLDTPIEDTLGMR